MHLHWQQHPGSGPYLLLVHGFLSSARQWEPNLAALAKVCRPVTVELWGHHRSPAPTDPNAYHPDAYIAEFEAIRSELGCESWFVCGYSLGAGLTIGYALQFPERVLGHAFTNSTSGLADAHQVAQWERTASSTAKQIAAGGIAALAKIPVHPTHAKVLPDPIKQTLVADALLHTPLGIANTLRYTNPRVSVRDRLSANSRPALLLWGQRERRFANHQAYAVANMPHLRVAALEAGHGVNMEATSEFDNALSGFIVAHQQFQPTS